jgi:TonB-linked SusC/RagA family outer membrane protein
MKKLFRSTVGSYFCKRVNFLLYFTLFTVFLASAQSSAQTNGIIKDKVGMPIPGVNIIIQGTTIGTQTDFDGRYTIDAKKGDVLIFSYIGYKSQKITVADSTTINLIMEEEASALDEVIVVGYGAMKKSDVIGSLSSVKVEEAVSLPTADVGSMLQGRASGVQITLNNAEPGGSSNILIRGRNSISGGNAPLVIVDGVPFNDINDVNPNAIESIEVLKDAASQAIYGARASNGVILITTKSGKAGKMVVSYDTFFAYQNVDRNFEFMDGFENAQIRREAQRFANERDLILQGNFDAGWAPEATIFPFDIQRQALQTGEFVDWEQVAFNENALKQNHSINLSGGTNKFKYSSSLRYFNQEGVLQGSGYDQYDIRTNAEIKLSDVVSVGTNITYSHTNRGRSAIDGATIANSPLASIFNEDGTFRQFPNGEANFFNPLIDLEEETQNFWEDKLILNLYADFKITEGLNYRLKGSTNQRFTKQERYSSSKSRIGLNTDGQGYIDHRKDNWLVLENIFTYNKDIGDHNIDATFVNALEKQTFSRQRLNGQGFPNDLLGVHAIETSLLQSLNHAQNDRSLVSFMGRFQYGYKDKYMINLTMRADGSSVFATENKWGYFPSIALGWTLTKESFMESFSEKIGLSNLKLRASYGQVGNQAIGPYQTLGTANDYGYVFGNPGSVNSSIGYAPGGRLPNPNLRWETTSTLNTALDFAFLNGKIDGTIEYYNTQTRDLLLSRSIPSLSGYTSIRDNLGQVENQGLEVSLNYNIITTEDFYLSFGTNVFGNRNKIVALYGDLDGDGIEDDNVAQEQFIGQPIDVDYDYQFDGIWQQTNAGSNGLINASDGNAIFNGVFTYPGDIRLRDVDGDGVITPNDRIVIPSQADWTGSFTLNGGYKGFDFLVDVFTVQGLTKLNPYLHANNRGGALNGNKNGISRDYYTPERPSLTVPRPNTNINNLRTLAYQDASYWRIRNITLGYTFPDKVLERMSLSNLRIFVTGFNMFTWTDYLSYSPEVNPDDYPETRDLTIGLNIKF